jgi:hypothetical protein
MRLDVRRIADLDGGLPDGRCQLYVGHFGAHAVLLGTASGWVLRSWTAAGVAVDAPFGPVIPTQLPWGADLSATPAADSYSCHSPKQRCSLK